MVDALAKLELAVNTTARSLNASKANNPAVLTRISSYREIIRRQHALIEDIERASASSDWQEVSRLTNLVYSASLMIKVDVGFLLSNLKTRPASATTTH